MNFDDIEKGIREARDALSLADTFVSRMAGMIVGRLRKANVSLYILKQLKKELESFNMHTGRWK